MLSSRLALLLGIMVIASPAQQAPGTSPPSYRLQKGDTVEVRVFNLPELTQTAVVRPDGVISFQLVGEINASGMTSEELAKVLTDIYGKRFRQPEVSVAVLSFANQTVYVGGEVNQPTALPLVGNLTLTAAIFRSGGFKETAVPESVELIRAGEGGDGRKQINVQAILRNGAPDIELKPGDVIFVPKSTINIYVGGEVAQPGLQVVQGKQTLLSAVIKAGGPTRAAAVRSIILVRDSGQPGKPTISTVSLEGALHDPSADVPLQPFDVVYIPKTAIAKIDQFVDSYLRQTIPLQLSGGFSYLLNGALVTGK
jgi:protein involved in polysaccharide export with SLBB domain